MIFFVGFFFQSDRPTQYQETISALNEKKRGMALCKWKFESTVLKGNDSLQYQYNSIYDYMKIDHFSLQCVFFCTCLLSAEKLPLNLVKERKMIGRYTGLRDK